MAVNDPVQGLLIEQWQEKLEGEQKRLEAMLASETEEEIKAEFQEAFAENKERLAALDEMKNRQPKTAPAELLAQVQLVDYVHALTDDKTGLQGAARELNQELGFAESPNSEGRKREIDVPWAVEGMTDKLPQNREFADEVTTLPAGAGQAPQNRMAVSPKVFKRSIMEFLNLSMPAVEMGEVEYPYIVSGPVAGAVAEGAGKDAEEFTLDIARAQLKSIAAGAQITQESLARYGEAEWDNLIRNHLRSTMEDQMQNLVLLGTGASNQPTGILRRINTEKYADGRAAGAYNEAMTWNDAIKALYAHLSDPEMYLPSDLAFLIGKETLVHLAGLYRSAESDKDVLDRMREKGARVRWTGRIPSTTPYTKAATSTIGKRQTALLMSNYGAENTIVPTWMGFRLLYDPFVSGKPGIVSFWARSMFDVAYRRSAANTIAGAEKLAYVLSDDTT
ncbi:MAG: hypothetical protein OXE52_04930 [Chloroflexi bacterium]|nr:hypothetical protein [Chloroflexota bacterium]